MNEKTIYVDKYGDEYKRQTIYIAKEKYEKLVEYQKKNGYKTLSVLLERLIKELLENEGENS